MLGAVIVIVALQLAAANSTTFKVADPQNDLGFDATTVKLSEWNGTIDAVTRKKAEFGDPAAQTKLGVSYARGSGDLPRDPEAALQWLRRAATGGSIAAEEALGLVYMTGTIVKRDGQEAAHWFESAARHGEPKAYTNLGILYLNGDGVPRDVERGRRLLEKAAKAKSSAAEFDLGLLYESGNGVPISFAT